jgi:hypothetical protein
MSSVTELLARWERLKGGRGLWEQHWEDLAIVMRPSRRGFVSGQIDGDYRSDEIFDGTPMIARRGLANAIGGMLRPDGEQWVFIKTEDEIEKQDDAAKEWLADSEERLRNALNNPKARFRQATGEADDDLVTFGTACVFTGESSRLDRLLFQTVDLKDAYIELDEDGEVDTMFRRRRMTARQARQRFGENAGPEAKQLLAQNRFEQKVEYLHIVLPRDDGRTDAAFARNLPFASLWIEAPTKTQVSESGYHEFPFAVPRWDTASGEDYGRSPGMIALPDSNTLQSMGETILVAGQRAADPPLAVPDDGSYNPINDVPGGLCYYDMETARMLNRIPIEPLKGGTNLPIARDMQKDTREQIYAAYFRNVLNLPIDRPTMTATEVIERKEEFIREIGAVFGRLETDYTAKMVERPFQTMLRANAFAPIPDSLLGRNVRFEYSSPVKKIRKQIEAMAADVWAAGLLNLAKQGVPDALDFLNVDEYAKFTHEARGAPRDIINSAERVAQVRQIRAQVQAQEAQKDDMERVAAGGEKVAGAMQKIGMQMPGAGQEAPAA